MFDQRERQVMSRTEGRQDMNARYSMMLGFVCIMSLPGCASSGGDPSALPPPNPVAGPAAVPSSPSAPPQAASQTAQPAPVPVAQVAPTAATAPPIAAQTSPAAVSGLADPWPRDVTLSNADAMIYQPQIESWAGNQLRWRVAVALRPTGTKNETFGVLWGSARTQVDRVTRSVALQEINVSQAKFPTLKDDGAAYLPGLRTALQSALATMALDSLEASLAASQTVKPTAHAVRNEPPQILVSYGPAILVPIDGPPVFKPMADSRFERVINTQAMIAKTKSADTLYLHVYDGWMSAPSIAGPWTTTATSFVPFGLDAAAKQLATDGTVDLFDGGSGATPKPSLANGAPAVYISQVPTELIVFKGQPNLVPITGTPLLWANNSAIDVIVDTSNSNYYVLISGRWYRGAALSGPWTYVASNALPPSFKQIPATGSPASVVLQSVAGTPQAQEAIIANSIPQTASIARKGGPTFTPVFDGVPKWEPVTGTPMQYVVNAKVPVIQVDPSNFFAVQGGVWFAAPSVTGPWAVATSVPAVDVHDSRFIATALRDLCQRLWLHEHGGLSGLHTGIHGHRGRHWRNGGLRHGLRLHAVDRQLLVCAAFDLGHRGLTCVQPVRRFHFWFCPRADDSRVCVSVLGRRVLPRWLLRLSVLRLSECQRVSQLGSRCLVGHAHLVQQRGRKLRHHGQRFIRHCARHHGQL